MTALVELDLSAPLLDRAALLLAVDPFRLGRPARTGGPPLRLPDMGLADQFRQPRPRVLAIGLLGAESAGGDDDLAGRVHPASGQPLEPAIDVRRQAKREHVAT